MNETFYRFRAEAAEEPASAELLIFDVIGNWSELGEVSAKQFAGDLAKLPTSIKQLDIHINSPGGSVSEAQGIYSRLADHRSNKHVYVDGIAASAASIIAMVGHKIYIRSNANMMIHLPSGLAFGDAEEMRKMAAALDSITEAMINTYARKTKLDRDELRSLLAAETWFSAQEAVEKGFADEVRGVVKAAAMLDDKRAMFNGLTFDLSRFHNVPAFTAATSTGEHKMEKDNKKTKATAAQKTPPDDDEKNKGKTGTGEGTGEGEGNGNGGEGNGEGAGEGAGATQATPKKPATGTATADYDKGIQAERDRVTALQALDRPATHEIVTAAIKDGKQPADIVAACMEAMDKASKQSARHADARQLDGIPPSDGSDGNDFGGRLKSAVKAKLKARGQRNQRSVTHGRN